MSLTTNVRLFLWMLLGVALLLNWEQWQRDYPPPVPVVAGATGSSTALDANAPVVSANGGASTTPAAASGAVAVGIGNGVAEAAPSAETAASAGTIHVRTDVLDLDLSLLGGELRRADLLQYPVIKGQAPIVRLLSPDDADRFVVQTGLAGPEGGAAPTHRTVLTSTMRTAELAPGESQLRVPLTWTDGNGVTVTKTYVFTRGQYRIDVDYHIENRGTTAWRYAPYAEILRNNVPVPTSYFHPETYSFKGPAYYDGAKYQKIKLPAADSALDRDVTGGWIAAMQHHFVAAVVPAAGASYRYKLRNAGTQFLLSATGAMESVAPGAVAAAHETLYVGPKLQDQLSATGPGLFRVADYGWLTTLAQPLFWLLDHVHRFVGNWGFTIMIVTFMLKLVFYPLSEASGRSMAKMKALGPRIKQLQETYKDERDKLGRAMMELYQREKVNPVSGCLPMLIQFPVFLAFYWVLLESVEMRQAPFIGWIQDLSARDPWFVLPVIMAGAMFIQYKLNPAPADPVQAKLFMIMPLAMSVTFAFFPSGLVLYWVTNTVLGILQQWNINRRITAREARARS